MEDWVNGNPPIGRQCLIHNNSWSGGVHEVATVLCYYKDWAFIKTEVNGVERRDPAIIHLGGWSFEPMV